jgi:CheY-like chemotaxis protein
LKTILVIDDEVSLVQVMRLVLQDEGYDVLTAWNGRVGLTVLASHSVDLILCDVMPIMTGPKMCRALQQVPTQSSPPVILMSGTGVPHDRDGYQYVAFLVKPFHLTDLIDVVKTRIGSGEAA